VANSSVLGGREEDMTLGVNWYPEVRGGPGARATRFVRLFALDPRGASPLHLPVLSRPRKTNPRLPGPVKLTLATDFWRYDHWLWRLNGDRPSGNPIARRSGKQDGIIDRICFSILGVSVTKKPANQ